MVQPLPHNILSLAVQGAYKLLCQSFGVQIAAIFFHHLLLDIGNFRTRQCKKVKSCQSELMQLLSVVDCWLQSTQSVNSWPDWGRPANKLRSSILYCLDNLMLVVFTLI